MELKKHLIRSMVFFALVLQVPSSLFAGTPPALPTVTDPGYRIQALMPRIEANGFSGLAFDSQGSLYAGVVQGSTTYRIDKESGTVSRISCRLKAVRMI